jgi:hypothetical protein
MTLLLDNHATQIKNKVLTTTEMQRPLPLKYISIKLTLSSICLVFYVNI